jgi:Arc-like DNA binding domain
MQWTIRDVPPELDSRVRQVAKEKGLSLNKAVLQVVESSFYGEGSRRKKRDLSKFVGTIRGKDAELYLNALKEFEKIDKEAWK